MRNYALLYSSLFGLLALSFLSSCNQTSTAPASNVENKTEFSLTTFSSMLGRCDNLELIYFAPEGRISSSSNNPTEIGRFSMYVDSNKTAAMDCPTEGMVILRGRSQIVIELDYALDKCSFVQVKMQGKTYQQALTAEGKKFFANFSKFPKQ